MAALTVSIPTKTHLVQLEASAANQLVCGDFLMPHGRPFHCTRCVLSGMETVRAAMWAFVGRLGAGEAEESEIELAGGAGEAEVCMWVDAHGTVVGYEDAVAIKRVHGIMSGSLPGWRRSIRTLPFEISS